MGKGEARDMLHFILDLGVNALTTSAEVEMAGAPPASVAEYDPNDIQALFPSKQHVSCAVDLFIKANPTADEKSWCVEQIEAQTTLTMTSPSNAQETRCERTRRGERHRHRERRDGRLPLLQE